MFRCLSCGARFEAHLPVCTHCFASHSLLPVGRRPFAAIDAEMELTDARSLARSTWEVVRVPAYPALELRRGALVVLVGPAGAGKSTFLARALDTISGTTMLVSLEEPSGPSLALRLARLGVKREGLLIAARASADQLAQVARDRRVTALGIDSVQRSLFEARELRHLLLSLSTLSVLFCTSQLNKAGDIRGSAEVRHEADVVIEFEAMRWSVTKSRYQATGADGEVFEQRRENTDGAA